MSVLYGFWRGMLLHLWQTTLVLAIILVIERSLRDAPSRARHALWSAGLLKLFLPLSIFGGAANALLRAAGGAGMRGDGALPLLPVVAALFPIADSGAPQIGTPASYALIAATTCWGAVAGYLISRAVVEAIREARYRGTRLASLPREQSKRLLEAVDRAGIPRDRVILCERFVMPTVVGLLNPKVLVPECLVRALSDEELRAVLLHEETHRRRRDPLRAAMCRLSISLFFFYPPLYLILRHLRATAEFACDESVVHSGVSASTYARALAQTLELGLASPAFATAAAAGRSLLRQRLGRLPTLNPRRYAMRMQYRVLISLAVVVVAGATFLPLPMSARSDGNPAPAVTAQEAPDTAAASLPFDEPPKLIELANPKYPERGRKFGIQTTVLLSVLVNEKGEATEIRPLEAPELEFDKNTKLDTAEIARLRALFVKSAVAAAKKWKFEAGTLKGKPVSAKVAVPVRFKLH